MIRSGPSSFCTCSSGRRSSDRLDSASVAVRPLWMYVCCLPAMRPVRLPSHLSGCSSHLSGYVCRLLVCTDRLSGFWSILDVVSAVRFRRNHRCSGCLAIRLIAWLSLCISVVGLIQPSFGALFVCVLSVGLRLCQHLLLLRLRPFNVNQLCFWF